MSTILNFISNLAICLGAGTFYIMLFSNIAKGNKAVEKFPATAHWLVKIGLSFTATGAFLNLLVLSTPGWTEIIMNIGLAALFIWAAVYHAKKFGVLNADVLTNMTGMTQVLTISEEHKKKL